MDVTIRSAREQARLIREGEMSARELLDAVLDRYQRHNPAVNAVVVTRIDQARSRAAEARHLPKLGNCCQRIVPEPL